MSLVVKSMTKRLPLLFIEIDEYKCETRTTHAQNDGERSFDSQIESYGGMIEMTKIVYRLNRTHSQIKINNEIDDTYILSSHRQLFALRQNQISL